MSIKKTTPLSGSKVQAQSSPSGHAAWGALATVAVAGVLFVVYVLTKAPTITWQHTGADSGELALAAATLGVPHPPGYPVWVLLGHLATLVLPGEDIGGRLALFSSLAGAGAAAAVTWVVYALGRRSGTLTPAQSAGVAGGAGLLLGVSPVYWSQATIGEVYALLALFCALLCLLIVPWSWTPGSRRRMFATGLAIGLGMGVHLTIVFFTPLWAISAWRRVTRTDALLGVAGLVLGLMVFGVLPVLAARQPPVSWGDAATLDGFLWLVTAAQYRGYLDPLALGQDIQRGLDLLPVTLRQMGGIGWVLAGAGAVGLWRQDRQMALGLAVPVLLCAAYVLAYQTADAHVYLIPALVSTAVLAGYGAVNMLGSLPGDRVAAGFAVIMGAMFLAALITGAASWKQLDLSHDRTALAYAETVTAGRSPQDVILADGDRHIFSLWYYCGLVEKDSCPRVVAPALLQYAWYRRQIAAQTGLVPGTEDTYDAALRNVLALAQTGRLFISTTTYPLPEGYLREPQPDGLYRLVPT